MNLLSPQKTILAAFPVLLSLLVSCTSVKPTVTTPTAEVVGGIVGGKPADAKLVKSVVGVYDAETSMLCSGTLISRHIVLTAAHCIGSDVENMKVLLGPNLNDGKAIIIDVDKMQVHEFFAPLSKTDRSDIALLYFKTELPADYKPIALPPADDKLSALDNLYLVGYGDTDYQKNNSGILRMVNRKGAEVQVGQPEFQMDVSNGRGTCVGDSGGPVLRERNGKMVLVGMDSAAIYNIDPVTHKPKQNPCRHRSIFTKVSYFLPWIQTTLKMWELITL